MSSEHSTKPRFGDAAVRLGYVSADAVNAALGEQAQQRRNAGTAGQIGALLMDKGLLTPEQITAVLRHVGASDLPLSEDGIRLAARLKVLHSAAGNVIGITGTLAEDAAQAAVELAVALAVMEQGQVLLIDANLRKPSLHQALGTEAAPGWIERIRLGEAAGPARATALAALSLVPAGRVEDDFMSLCMSPEAGERLEACRQRHRYVLVNLGQVLHHPEAAVVASRCDGVVTVLRAGHSQKSELRDLQRLLQGLKVGLSGIVLAGAASRAERRRA
nr:hypothetical protein [uncultured Roseateles sp.]